MKRYIVCFIVCSFIIVSGCTEKNRDCPTTEETEQLEMRKNQAEAENHTEQIDISTENDTQEEEPAEITLQYIPEMGYRSTIEGGGIERPGSIIQESSYACWKDWLIIGTELYKRENGIYKKLGNDYVEEMFGAGSYGSIKQYKNLIITVEWHLDDNPEFQIFDLDAWEKVELQGGKDMGEFRGDNWKVFDGNIYYSPYNYQSIHKIDLLSGRDEEVYSLDGEQYQSHMIEDFAIRDDGAIMVVVRSVNEDGHGQPVYIWDAWEDSSDGLHHIEYWLVYPEEDKTMGQKIGETDVYAHVESVDFNQYGFFQRGYFPDPLHWPQREYMMEYAGITCLEENGELELICSHWEGGFYLTENGYYLEDSIKYSGKLKKPSAGLYPDYRVYIDAVSKYDFEGNKIETYCLTQKDILAEGWYLLELICYKDELTAIYANDDKDELYISQVQL